MRNYKALSAWQRADELTFMIYQVTKLFPVEEIYGITSQLRRSSYSVPANIAEGCGRESNMEYLRFLSIARGSLTETEYFLHLVLRHIDFLWIPTCVGMTKSGTCHSRENGNP